MLHSLIFRPYVEKREVAFPEVDRVGNARCCEFKNIYLLKKKNEKSKATVVVVVLVMQRGFV